MHSWSLCVLFESTWWATCEQRKQHLPNKMMTFYSTERLSRAFAAAAQAQMRRARAALPRDPNEPPRKRGRPRKERPLAADGSSPSTPSDKSTDTDVSIRQFFTRGHPAEEKEGADDLEAFRTPPSLTPPGSPTQRGSREVAQVCQNLPMLPLAL